jgi:methylenetetrahydrofolate--tRNA-(uracil-5-)-methyltransferase
MAERGPETLRFGCMKPVGLDDPRTGRWPYAVVQLRPEDVDHAAYNLVGFQTRMKWGDQLRVFRMIPGLQDAEFLRMGQIHRNTYLDAPAVLDAELRLRSRPNVRFAGQITGVEGYVESAACGYLAALAVHARLTGAAFQPPPGTTALGALHRHVTGEAHPEGHRYQPTNVVYALFPPLPGRVKRQDKRARYAARARADFDAWAPAAPHPVAPGAPLASLAEAPPPQPAP